MVDYMTTIRRQIAPVVGGTSSGGTIARAGSTIYDQLAARANTRLQTVQPNTGLATRVQPRTMATVINSAGQRVQVLSPQSAPAMQAAAERLYAPQVEARRFAQMAANANQAPYGIGGGGTDQFFDATAGGIKGQVVVLLAATEAIDNSGTDVIDSDIAFSSTHQSRVRPVGRVLERLFI